MNKKVILGMSGGTDSSTSAILLLEQGYEVIGVTFIFCEGGDHHVKDAQTLALKLGIKHIVYEARDMFKNKIINYFIDEYMQGRTPVPCMLCNNFFKWPLLASIADEQGAEYISTGHYVRVDHSDNGRVHIQSGLDPDKDQSFFLWGLTPAILRRMVLPLGGMTKTAVRALALEKGFTKVAEKKDSMSICFCPGDYRDYLKSNVEKERFIAGDFVDESGKVVGRHNGCAFYTVGQRRGLGLNMQKAVFVKEIDTVNNRVVLAHLEGMYKNSMILKDVNVNYPDEIDGAIVNCRIRYRKQNTPSRVTLLDGNKARVEFLQPLESVAPGQSAAFYIDDLVVGGGIIDYAED